MNWRVYTGVVLKRRIFLGLAAALTLHAAGSEQQGVAPDQSAPRPGVLVSHVKCAAAPDQSYALYLPSQYSSAKAWPIVYVCDPLARGNVPVERMKDAAERYGFVVAASNNSRNGPWKIEIDAAQAMSDDTHTRLSIDDKRVYFAGFSGGARVASHIAQVCKCAAGVLLNGAGFPIGRLPTRDVIFPVFAAVGDLDFNYPEVTRLDQTLAQLGFPHVLRYFDGPHQWAPAVVMDEAFAWFRVMAMKESREQRDEAFIAAQREAAAARAHAFEQSGDLYSALREYRQAGATFDGLSEAGSFQRAASSLAGQKAVRDAQKQQKQELEEQAALTADISDALNALQRPPTERSGLLSQTERRIVELRQRAEHEKRPDKARVLQRSVSDVFAQALETGFGRMADNDATSAKDYFQLALAAQPNSIWALHSLAAACASSGDRNGALENIRRSKEKTEDPEAFAAWVQGEMAFDRLRQDPQFQALLAGRLK